jgi:hypothetical protein
VNVVSFVVLTAPSGIKIRNAETTVQTKTSLAGKSV